MEQIADVLRQMVQNGTPVAEIAENADVHVATIYRILKGDRGIGSDVLIRLARAYPEVGRVFLALVSPDGENIS